MSDLRRPRKPAIFPVRRKNKYGARKVEHDGRIFASVRECERYKYLRLREKAGEIRDLEWQIPYPFVVNGTPVRGASGRQLKIILDFRYWDIKANKRIYEDSKGFATKDWLIKRAFFEALTGESVIEV